MEGRGKGGSDNRVQEVAEISRGLKQIARELNIPVLALAQLSRAVEQTKPAIPRLSHLRDSGSIEQDADIVMFIYRKAADRNYREEELAPEEKNLAEVHIAKHRNGPTGVVRLFFDKRTTSFKNMDRRYAPQGNQQGPGPGGPGGMAPPPLVNAPLGGPPNDGAPPPLAPPPMGAVS
jgi:replicative DNA helicase